MQFEPKSEAQLRAEMLISEGEYDFEVLKADDKLSSGGNDMIALVMRVWDHEGVERQVRDWLVNSDAAMCQLKIRNFCASTGLMEQYQDGSLDAMACTGVAGRVAIGSKTDPQYGPQNTVQGYVCEAAEAVQAEPLPKGPTAKQTKRANEALAEAASDDDVPF
jgi:hypothetical protein